MSDYHNLDVYNLAYVFSLDVLTLSETFPKTEKYRLVDQLNRSARSIPANVAEGYSRLSEAEKRYFFYIALGSASESEHWLTFAKDAKFMSQELHSDFDNRIIEIKKKLRAMINRFSESIKTRK